LSNLYNYASEGVSVWIRNKYFGNVRFQTGFVIFDTWLVLNLILNSSVSLVNFG